MAAACLPENLGLLHELRLVNMMPSPIRADQIAISQRRYGCQAISDLGAEVWSSVCICILLASGQIVLAQLAHEISNYAAVNHR